MKCPNCQFENPDSAKFCKSCGHKLSGLSSQPSAAPESAAASAVCSACGAALKPGAKFCAKCGTPVKAAAMPETVAAAPENIAITPEVTVAAAPENAAAVPEIPEDTAASTTPDAVQEPDVVIPVPVPPVEIKPETASEPAEEIKAETVSSPAFCKSCGAPLKPGAKFCNKCGAAASATKPESVPVPKPIPEPKPVPVPDPIPEPEPVPASFCKTCGAPLKPGAKFCSKCGTVTGKQTQAPDPIPVSVPDEPIKKKPVKPKDDSTGKTKPSDKKKINPLIIVLCVLLVLLLLAAGFFALVKTGVINFGSSEIATEDPAAKEGEETSDTAEDTETAETEESEDDLAGLEEKLAPIADQVSSAEDKLNSEDYGGAGTDLTDALNAYAALASEYESQSAIDTINPLADSAFALYTTSILKQVEGWESQSVTAPLYQQIDATLQGAVGLATQLREANLTVNTDELDQNYAEFPDRYKEKYILTFNDLRTGDEWSRTTAWQYMQDAASVGLVDRENINDPLTLRYAYALAWITQRDLSEGMKDGSVTTESAISSILSLAESIDYNPVLMRDLALYYDALGDSDRSQTMQAACTEVYNYLANTENVYLNGEELFVPGRNSSNASSTISLNDFWYFNDFGEYAPSGINNGVSPEGREYIRNIYKEAINAL